VHLTVVALTTVRLTVVALTTVHLAVVTLTTVSLTTVSLTTVSLTVVALRAVPLKTVHLKAVFLAPPQGARLANSRGRVRSAACSRMGLPVVPYVPSAEEAPGRATTRNLAVTFHRRA
jgi:hypothetical protein